LSGVSSTLNLAGDRTAPPDTHVAFWIGEFPCDATGRRMDELGNPESPHGIDSALNADLTFSRRPQPSGGYPDYHAKMTTYVAMIEGQAQRVDKTVSALRRRPARPEPGQSVFEYVDTASARAGIGPINSKLASGRIAIIGLGGTGSYVLDLVAKTPVAEIHLFDDDVLLTHNAFRSPGAPAIADLQAMPKKVAWLASIYSRMRRGIVPHEFKLDSSNVSELVAMDFAFVCMDSGPDKRAVVESLVGAMIPFIDVGIGLVNTGAALSGSVRVTRSTRDKSDHLVHTVAFGAQGVDAYDDNIQVADMNSLSATLAVIRWKKETGFYVDFGYEYSMVYSVATNTIINSEAPDESPSPAS
jgi:hypothetical protein